MTIDTQIHTPEAAAQRTPPNDITAERAVLGALVLAGVPGTPEAVYYDEILATGITAADYYRPNHGTIHTAILAAREAGEPVDVITLGYELNRMGELQRVGGASYLHDLIADVPTAASGAYYAGMVREKAYRRHILSGMKRVEQLAHDPAGDRDLIEQTLTEIVTGIPGVTSAPPLVDDLMSDFLAELEEIQTGTRTGISYGFTDLDDLTGGMKPGNVTVIAAPSGVGKSTLALNFATTAARAGHAVQFSSLEMSNYEVLAKIIADEMRVPLGHLMREGALTEQGWEKVRAFAASAGRDLRLRIHQPDGATLSDIAAAARATKRESGLDVLAVDYLQLVEVEARAGANREQAVAAVSRGLKNLAVQLGCHVIALSQLNDDGMMRESRAIKNDATFVFKIQVPDEDENREGEMDVFVEKNRFGSAGRKVPVSAQLHYSRFSPMGA